MENKNRYEVTGMVKQIRQYPGRENLVVVGFVLEHKGVKKTEEFKMICFNKLAQYLLDANPVGHEVEVTSHLQIDKNGDLTIIAHRVNDLTVNHSKEREVADPFDALKEEYVDMVAAGILDPAKVTRSALQNATSVASTLLTTESVVASIKEDTPAMPAGGAGMGMM